MLYVPYLFTMSNTSSGSPVTEAALGVGQSRSEIFFLLFLSVFVHSFL